MRNTQPEHEETEWMRTQIREAAFGMTFISVTIFTIWVLIESKWGDWESKLALAVGIISGVLLSTLVPRPVDPAHFGIPFVKPYHQKPTPIEEELMACILQRWRQFPRLYFWLVNIPYLTVLVILMFLTQHKPPYPGMDLGTHPSETMVGFFLLTSLGFVPGASLCWGIFFTYLLRTGICQNTERKM